MGDQLKITLIFIGFTIITISFVFLIAHIVNIIDNHNERKKEKTKK